MVRNADFQDEARSNAKLDNMCAHASNACVIHKLSHFKLISLPSLKRAGAVRLREVLPAIVSLENILSTGENV